VSDDEVYSSHGENAGQEARGDESRGDESRGDEARGDEARGDESRGDEARGDEARGDEVRGDESNERSAADNTSAYVSIRQHTSDEVHLMLREHASADEASAPADVSKNGIFDSSR
jgi:hypothetical protein